MKDILLETKYLKIGYTRQRIQYVVYSNLNLNLRNGELVCLLGSNGAGKSTLLKTLGRLIPPLGGSILIEKQNIDELTPKIFSTKTGLVLTEKPELWNITAREIISLGRYPYTGFWGKLTEQDWELVGQAAEQAGVETILDRQFMELSDGEKQKVMIAKALAQKTPIILLDEPMAFLDFPSKSNLLLLLRKLAHEQNLGIILSTHDIELALRTADRIWLIPEKGKLIDEIPEDMVMKGHIHKAFKNKDLSFDVSTGHFENSFEPQKFIKVSGDPVPTRWLTQALNRNQIGTDGPSDWHVECGENYCVEFQGSIHMSFRTIAEVLRFLNIQ